MTLAYREPDWKDVPIYLRWYQPRGHQTALQTATDTQLVGLLRQIEAEYKRRQRQREAVARLES